MQIILALSCMSSGHKLYLDRAKEVKEKVRDSNYIRWPASNVFPEIVDNLELIISKYGMGNMQCLIL